MTLSPFDHPFLSGLFDADRMAGHFSAEADIRAMLDFEAALARAEAENGVIPGSCAQQIAQTCAAFKPDIAALKTATAVDGVVVPGLIKQLRKAVGAAAADHVHFGATSQDVIDSSLVLRLKYARAVLVEQLSDLIGRLDLLERQFGTRRLMGYTRMQAAIPITVADRLRSWRDPLAAYRQRLTDQKFPVQFGGAAGTLDRLGSRGANVRAALARALGLADLGQWQSQRAWIAEFANLLSLITGSLGKIGQDTALLALSGDDIALAGGGTSSAMAHKQNPVAAETLVTLARFNATQLSGMHQSLVHEQERSGAAWALEWLILPQMVMASSAALRLATQSCASIKSLGRPAD